MKNRADRILLAVFLVTAALYVVFLLMFLDIIPRPFGGAKGHYYSILWEYLALTFHAVPCFCVQLLLCRTAKHTVIRLIPVLLLAGTTVVFTIAASDLRYLCIAPAVVYGLVWAVYGIRRMRRWIDE